MTEDIIISYEADSSLMLSDAHVESFLTEHEELGYAACKLRDKYRIARHFVAWTQVQKLSATAVAESHVMEHLESFKQVSKERLAFKRALLFAFLEHLRKKSIVAWPREPRETTPAKRIEQDYANYLRDERGLSFRSLLVYLPHVRTFLDDYMTGTRDISLEQLNAEIVRAFLLSRLDDHGSESARLLTVALRSFLRFLFFRGVTQIDLSSTITAIRKTRGAGIHAFLSSAEVEQVLSAPDLATPVGRRDRAILLILARLGLRAGEIVALELEDICWRTGEIIVRGKGGGHNRLPLLKDVGMALALYIKSDRAPCDCRKVFLRSFAPRVGFSGPAAVGHIVRKYMKCAGVQRPPHVAAHLFRHTLATGMLHHGASLTEISEILGHDSITTTEIYSKVAFESLRTVARPWPGEGVV
jgi:site-specific recombinase XerD